MSDNAYDMWVDEHTKVTGYLNGVGIEFEIYSKMTEAYQEELSYSTELYGKRFTFTVKVEELT